MKKLVLPFLLVGLLTAAEDKKSDLKGEFKKFQGTWIFATHQFNGKDVPAEQLKQMTITFDGDKFTVKADGQVVQAGTNKLDPSKKPHHIDAKVTEGERKGVTMLGVYEWDGDTLKFCFDETGKKRPQDTKSAEGVMSGSLKRKK